MAKKKTAAEIAEDLKRQIQELAALGTESVEISALLDAFSSSLDKYLSKNVTSISKLTEVQSKLKEAVQKGTTTNKAIEAVTSDLTLYISDFSSFVTKVSKINDKVDKLSGKSMEIAKSPLKDFDLKPINDFFTQVSKTFNAEKMEAISNAITGIDMDSVWIASEYMKNFKFTPILNFYSKLGKSFSATNMESLISSATEVDPEAIKNANAAMKAFKFTPYIKLMTTMNKILSTENLDKIMSKANSKTALDLTIKSINGISIFLTSSIKGIVLLDKRVRKLIGKLAGITGNTITPPATDGGQLPPDQTGAAEAQKKPKKRPEIKGLGDDWLKIAGFINKGVPGFMKIISALKMVKDISTAILKTGERAKNHFKESKFLWGKHEYLDKNGNKQFGTEKLKATKHAAAGVVNSVSMIGMAIGAVGGIIMQVINFVLEGVSKIQKMYLDAAKKSHLNELAFVTMAMHNGPMMQPNVTQRFGIGGGEEKILEAQASNLQRFGGSAKRGVVSGREAYKMASISSIFNIPIEQVAKLKDIMEHIFKLSSSDKFLNLYNKYGLIANTIVKDISENVDDYIKFGTKSFENMSNMAAKLSINMKSALQLVEKFSTVSGAIDTSFNLMLTTGKNFNPLEMFMKYTYGSSDDILTEVLSGIGKISDAAPQVQRLVSQTTGMAINELVTAQERLNATKNMSELEKTAYNKQFKTLDDLTNNLGFQRLLGGLTEIFDMLKDQIFNNMFKGILDWLKQMNASKGGIQGALDKIVKTIKTEILPFVIDVFTFVAEVFIKVAAWITDFLGIGIGISSDAMLVALQEVTKKSKDYLLADSSTNATPQKTNDGYVSNGKLVNTASNDTGVFANSPTGLLKTALSAIANGDVSGSVTNISSGQQSSKSAVNIIKVSSDVKLDGQKVGEGLTEIAFTYG